MGDQPNDIEDQVRELIMEYIDNPFSIILSVSAANTDLATSESLKFAREVDPEGERTIAVLTKLDIMDPGTDAMEMLTGSVIPVKLGIIGVVNRSQRDINSKKNINEQLKNEKLFFQEHYKNIASRNGIPYLSKSLSELLMDHIYECLPRLRQDISQKKAEFQEIYANCGEEITNREAFFARVTNNLTNSFCGKIDGAFLQKDVAIGGASMRKIFDEIFVRALDAIEPQVSKAEVIEYVKNTGGPRATIFAPEVVFEKLIKQQIERLRKPSIDCLKLIFVEIGTVISKCICEQLEMERFPKLKRKSRDIITNILNERLPVTEKAINYQIDIELSSTNTNHPSFSVEEMIIKHDKKKDEKHAEVIEKLIRGYFPIVKRTIQDLVPKIIMHSLIVFMKINIHENLLTKLINDDMSEEHLLTESDNTSQRRDDAKNMLNALAIADETINEVSG